MEIPYLLLFDYDKTLFDTGRPSPNGIGLEEGHEHAVQEIFGPPGLAIYRDEGGLKNRAPSEVVISLIEKDRRLIQQAREKHSQLIRSSQKIPRALSEPWSETNPIPLLTEMLVYFKLDLFLGEIGMDWPQPYPGVCNFFQTASYMALKENLPLQTGVLSSGHTSFIEGTLCRWGIPYPQIMVTDDNIRPLKYPKDPRDKVKPAPFIFRYLQSRWLKQLNGNSPIGPKQLQASLSRIVYFGDDPLKDGGLAKNVGVPFGWFCLGRTKSTNPSPADLPKSYFLFNDWNTLTGFISQSNVKKMLRSGISVEEIFSRF